MTRVGAEKAPEDSTVTTMTPHDESPMNPTATAMQTGRAQLTAWLQEQPDNFFDSTPLLGAALDRFGGHELWEELAPRLRTFGGECATTLDRAAIVNNRPWNLPRLERWDAVGCRTEEIENHPSYHEAGRVIYESGMIGELVRDQGMLRALSFFVLSSMCGEAGHNCPVACTAGVVKSLTAVGSAELRATYLPRLLSAQYRERFDGAQFLTEVQGGSDVGANGCVATPGGGQTWRIDGEKWFCSNANADLILMTARYPGGPDGTAGLGLFLVPRRLADGSHNHFEVRRLKDKLGTRSMPSGEIDFRGAVAWAVGPVEDGFKTVMRQVINTSRLYNAVAVTGASLRATQVARGYAQHRQAFGAPISQFASVRENIALLAADSAACLVSSLELAALHDRLELSERSGASDRVAAGFMRVAVNLNKAVTARLAVESTLRGIEVLGGNGAIESFSVLPRLHRDMIVCENWEGTPGVLAAQIARDMARLGVDEAYFARVADLFGSLSTPTTQSLRGVGLAAVRRMGNDVSALLTLAPDKAAMRLKRMLTPLAMLWHTATLAQQAEHDLRQGGDAWCHDAAILLWNRHVAPWSESLPGDELALHRAVARL